MNRTVAVGAPVVGAPEGAAVVGADVVGTRDGAPVVGLDGAADVGDAEGFDGATVVGATVGPHTQRHWSLELHP